MHAAFHHVFASTLMFPDWLFIILLIAIGLIGSVTVWPAIRAILPSSKDNIAPISPLLFNETVGMNTDIFQGYSGMTPHGLSIEYYVGGLSLFSSETSHGVYAVELPFMSGVHLIGIPKTHSIPLAMSGHDMEAVTLEGNYNDVFHLYADTGEQVQSRYVLDPKAMVFTIDFCANFNWEIIEDTLYFMSGGRLPGFDIVDQFVEEIRPAVETPRDRPLNPSKLSYTHTVGRTLLCPICQQTLKNGTAWLECPQGHGCLVTGKQLLDMHDQKEPIPLDDKNLSRHGELTCPYCASPMNPTRYQLSRITIDVCSKCRFRWLDAEEPARLFGGNR